MKAPTNQQLIEAVRERMEAAIDRPVGGFEARVIRNVLAIVEREMELGPAVEERRVEVLEAFGASSDEDLAASIRSGALDRSAVELRGQLLGLAEAQLAIDNPRWL